jgi:hypothetical protein
MLKNVTVMELLTQKTWIYKAADAHGKPLVVYLGKRAGHGFLAVQFQPDGGLLFPAKLGFTPGEYQGWRFDEARQCLVFLDQAGQSTYEADLPFLGANAVLTIKVRGRDAYFEAIPEIDQRQVVQPAHGGRQMVLMVVTAIQPTTFATLGRQGFNLHALPATGGFLAQLNAAYRVLADQPQLETVVLTTGRVPKLVPNKNTLQIKLEGADWCISGTRALVMELLNTLSLTANLEKLTQSTDALDEMTLVNRVLTDRFAGRVSGLTEEGTDKEVQQVTDQND